ncbi:MAG: hypothetical protein KIH08_03255 [Candidatus Freyarchaeota archaeon]|nr:hypothetical protein [Candidatus Jordarchaeia archaeon]MBS7270087.1 hypothetical protein [Candidatus Jordarchaeia archaeon]MBS7280763.1 hypothetical protein [Candidatus Jordarchaeia archaeon]
MSTGFPVSGGKKVVKMNALVAGKGEETSSGESLDTLEAKLIGCMAKIRDEVVQGIKARFPIKGLEIVAGQAFDSALEKHFDSLLSIWGSKLKRSPLKNNASRESSETSKRSQDFGPSGGFSPQSRIKTSEILESSGRGLTPPPNANSQIGMEEEEKVESLVRDYQKRIDELMLGIKARDSKILELKKEIEKLQKSIEILETQASSPFIYPTSPNSEEVIHIQNQMRSLMEFMRRITPILNKDPKYRIMFLLKRVGKSPISKLGEELGIPPQKLDSLLKELETMKIIRREEDTVFLMDVH